VWLTNMVFKIHEMKYYSNYQDDRVYSLDPEGNGTAKEVNFTSTRPVRFNLKTWKAINVDPLSMQEENGVGYLMKEITKEEFDGFGTKWIWNPLGGINEPIITL